MDKNSNATADRPPNHFVDKQFSECTPLFQAYEREISPEDRTFVEELREREKRLLVQ
jgi:hypothetical protein